MAACTLTERATLINQETHIRTILLEICLALLTTLRAVSYSMCLAAGARAAHYTGRTERCPGEVVYLPYIHMRPALGNLHA